MERHDERQPERALELHRDEPRHEEVRVHDVVALTRRESLHECRELRDPRQDVLLADERGGAGRHVHDAHSGQPLDDLGQVGLVLAGEHVDEVAARREIPRRLGYVDVLAAAVDSPDGGERRRMVADDRYPLRHVVFLLERAPEQPTIVQSPCHA